jgi:hypothetical protein
MYSLGLTSFLLLGTAIYKDVESAQQKNNLTQRMFEDFEGRANDELVERAPGHDLNK